MRIEKQIRIRLKAKKAKRRGKKEKEEKKSFTCIEKSLHKPRRAGKKTVDGL